MDGRLIVDEVLLCLPASLKRPSTPRDLLATTKTCRAASDLRGKRRAGVVTMMCEPGCGLWPMRRAKISGRRRPQPRALTSIVAGDETKFEKSERAMKFAATFLIAPALSVLALALLETRVIYPPPANGATKGIVWGGHTFATRADFARWLRSRGVSYRVWVRRHPSPYTGGADSVAR